MAREEVMVQPSLRNTLHDRVTAIEEQIQILMKYKANHDDHLSAHDDEISKLLDEVGL